MNSTRRCRMQFRLQDDILKQQQKNAREFMERLEKEYLDVDVGSANDAIRLGRVQ